MSCRMGFAIVLNSEPAAVIQDYNAASGELNLKAVFVAKLVPHNNPENIVEAARNYCKRLNELLGKDESGKENLWQVCAHFKINPKKLCNWCMDARLHGRLLEELRGLCGETLKFTFEGKLISDRDWHRFKTPAMRLRPYSTIAQVSDESGCWEFNHAIQAYCEELSVRVSSKTEKWHEINRMTAKIISFYVRDTYINLPNGGGSLEGTRYQLDVLKTIMRHEASSDISIHGVDDFKVAAHKCFLIAHSPVLKEMVRQCRFGRIKLRDVSVNCIKALLEYIYTFQLSHHALECCKVAMELFVFATKYEMRQLQCQLAKMMVERRNSWFNITETLDLFLFIRKLGRTSTIDELLGKVAQVLKWNGKKRIMRSKGYQRLVVGDLNAATELCASMANAN